VIRLLKKLEPEMPLVSLLLDIENEHLTINKVFYDEKLYGILVVRAVRTRQQKLQLVVNHAIAEDDIDVSFNNILGASLPAYVFQHGFDSLRFHTDKLGLHKIAQKWLGNPVEMIYEMEYSQWAAQTAIQIAHSKQVQRQATTE
jgi:hypothetical protein